MAFTIVINRIGFYVHTKTNIILIDMDRARAHIDEFFRFCQNADKISIKGHITDRVVYKTVVAYIPTSRRNNFNRNLVKNIKREEIYGECRYSIIYVMNKYISPWVLPRLGKKVFLTHLDAGDGSLNKLTKNKYYDKHVMGIICKFYGK